MNLKQTAISLLQVFQNMNTLYGNMLKRLEERLRDS